MVALDLHVQHLLCNIRYQAVLNLLQSSRHHDARRRGPVGLLWLKLGPHAPLTRTTCAVSCLKILERGGGGGHIISGSCGTTGPVRSSSSWSVRNASRGGRGVVTIDRSKSSWTCLRLIAELEYAF